MKNIRKITKATAAILVLTVILSLLHYARRALLFDSFIVNGISMEPVLHSGDKVWVNKLKMGARIYTDYDFTKPTLSSFRLPGFSRVNAGDIVVVNYPYALSKDTIMFKINYVYLKRCYGAPGDTVRIVGGYYVHPQSGGRIGNLTYQKELSETPDSVLAEEGVVLRAMQNKVLGWTIRDFGPLYVPRRGDTVNIDIDNYRIWRKPVLFETGKRLFLRDGQVFLGDDPVTSYTFLSSWYFLGGDNVLDSRDSRYIGLFPESYIIGIVSGYLAHEGARYGVVNAGEKS